MNLSGMLRAGTGSYEVKEIAPIAVNGKLSSSNMEDESMLTFDQATPNGFHAIADTSISRAGTVDEIVYVIGRWYKVKFLCTKTSGAFPQFAPRPSANSGDIAGKGWITCVEGYNEFIFEANSSVTGTLTWDNDASATEFTISDFTIEEVPEGYPLLDKGTKYLECTVDSGGVSTSVPSTQAYGEWEFDFKKGDDTNAMYIAFISTRPDAQYQAYEGYRFNITTGELIQLQRMNVGSNSIIMTTLAIIEINVWYRLKITRTLNGEFTLFIKGGDFGVADWTALTASTGTNPITDNTYSESEYFAINQDDGDCFANLEIRNLVKQ